MLVPLLDRIRSKSLLQIARNRFSPDLLEIEVKILVHSAGSTDPVVPVDLSPRPEVRPEFLRWFATDSEAVAYVDPKGIRVWSATIPGKLDLRACSIPHQLHFFHCDFKEDLWLITAEARALYLFGCKATKGIVADGINLHGPLFMRDLEVCGAISLVGARIGGNLDCSGAVLESTGTALALDGANIRGSVFLHKGFRSSGEIRMLNARIGGDLGCNGASISATGRALMLDKAIVEGLVSFSDGFQCSGLISLSGGQVFGDLDCAGANFLTADIALNLATAAIQGHLYLRNGFKSAGAICLHSTRVGNSLDCSGAVLTATGAALSLERAIVQGDVFLCDVRSSGRVELHGAQLRGDLNCDGATLPSLYCLNMKLDGELIWTSIQSAQQTSLWLNGASVKHLRDDRDSWPGPKKLHVDGLTYQELILHEPRTASNRKRNELGKEHEIKAVDRISWLNLQPPTDKTEPQPWVQFADLLKAKGDSAGSKRVIFEMRRHMAGLSWFVPRWWKILFACLEEQPLRILIPILLCTAFGFFVFWEAGRDNAMAPTSREAYSAWRQNAPFDIPYPRFNPFVYSLENNLPLVKLGQDDKWAPDPSHQPTVWIANYTFLSGFRWFLILAGWGQATVLASAIGSRFKA